MSRSSSERSEEIDEEFVHKICKIKSVKAMDDEDFDDLMKATDWYVEQKIKQMFDEENNRNEGKIKVRTENGILMLTPEEFEEYRKSYPTNYK